MSGNDLRIDRLLGELQLLLGPALEIGKIIVRHGKTFQGRRLMRLRGQAGLPLSACARRPLCLRSRKALIIRNAKI